MNEKHKVTAVQNRTKDFRLSFFAGLFLFVEHIVRNKNT